MTHQTNCSNCGSTNITATQDGEVLIQDGRISEMTNPIMRCLDCGKKFFKDNDPEAQDLHNR